jgi:uncharacterized protein (DUF1330 family)
VPVYFVVNSSIDDPVLLNEYVRAGMALPREVPLRALVHDSESKVIEGVPAGPRTVILEFDSEDDFHRWYDAPAYRQILDKRLAATTVFGVLVKGH